MSWRSLSSGAVIIVVTLAVAARGGPVLAQSSASATNPPVAYLEGLDALIHGRSPEAVTAFTRSLQANGSDPSVMLARGVARTAW